jgi:diaminohydroxyphosphoribosylaminopyrimidine deaminase/5-amino-6-(5-phosphoribosylamino)uracil reductase
VNDLALLERAAQLAAPWMTFPNPRVGCVIVDAAGVIVGEGAHHAAGGPHAEVHALAVAGARARGATAYVTLEPCNHHGRTGPCSQALIRAGIRRVVIAVADPNREAAGGAGALRAAGVVVDFITSPVAESVNEHWLHAMRNGRPFISLKVAASLDGRIAAAPGQETPISNAASRTRVHELRARVDGVLVGTNTACVDDPALTVREAALQRQPARFVMGRRDLPAGLQLLQGPQPAVQLRTHDAVEVLADLHARGIRHLLVEGGATIARAFVEAGLIDECIWITAPVVLHAGPTAVGATALERVHTWRRVGTVDVDGDLWSYLRP